MTGRSPVIRVAASAIAWASVASVLRPCPAVNTGVRADSLGGTSRTCSPSASSRRAIGPPIPWQPSMAHIRAGQCRTARTIARYPDWSVPYRPRPSTVSSLSITSIVADRLCGSIPITTVLICAPRPSPLNCPGEGGHRYFELSKPLLSLSLPIGTRPAQAK